MLKPSMHMPEIHSGHMQLALDKWEVAALLPICLCLPSPRPYSPVNLFILAHAALNLLVDHRGGSRRRHGRERGRHRAMDVTAARIGCRRGSKDLQSTKYVAALEV